MVYPSPNSNPRPGVDNIYLIFFHTPTLVRVPPAMVLVPLRMSPSRGIVAPLGGSDTFYITLLGTLTRLTVDNVPDKEFYSILQATED